MSQSLTRTLRSLRTRRCFVCSESGWLGGDSLPDIRWRHEIDAHGAYEQADGWLVGVAGADPQTRVRRPCGRHGDFISASGNFNTLGAFFCNVP